MATKLLRGVYVGRINYLMGMTALIQPDPDKSAGVMWSAQFDEEIYHDDQNLATGWHQFIYTDFEVIRDE